MQNGLDDRLRAALTTLGDVVRGGIPSAFDRVLATRLGAVSVDRLALGVPGVLVGVLGNDTVATSLANLAGRTRPIDMMDLFLICPLRRH